MRRIPRVIVFLLSLAVIAVYHTLTRQQRTMGGRTITLGAQQQASVPKPCLHRPYYGNRTISSRTVSFVDHDKPWYDYDGVFVRYDGKKWTGVSIGSCTGGVNCYDGHNGYGA